MSNENENQMEQDELVENQIILEKDQQILKLEKELVSIKGRALVVHQENEIIKSSKEVATQKAQMSYDLQMASQFVKSGAFPSMNPEQCYTLMKAGKEMGLQPVQALNTLYIVKGSINPYGAGMIALLTEQGYIPEYKEVSQDEIHVRVYKKDKTFDVTEIARSDDPQISGGKSLRISKRNKLRFHGIRLIINFHLPHLFRSVTDYQTSVMEEDKTNENGNTEIIVSNEDLLKQINEAKNLNDLEDVFIENKAQITRNINLTAAVGAMKKRYEG